MFTAQEVSTLSLTIYALPYVIFYYFAYIGVMRPFLKAKNGGNSLQDWRTKNAPANWVLHRYFGFISVFYCFDVPLGSAGFLRNDPLVLNTVEYQLCVKLCLALFIVFRAIMNF